MKFEQGVFIGDIDEFFVTEASPIGNDGKSGVPLFTVFSHNTGIIIRISGEEVLRIVITVYDDFSQGIVHVDILASFTDKVLQELGE